MVTFYASYGENWHKPEERGVEAVWEVLPTWEIETKDEEVVSFGSAVLANIDKNGKKRFLKRENYFGTEAAGVFVSEKEDFTNKYKIIGLKIENGHELFGKLKITKKLENFIKLAVWNGWNCD